VMDRHSIKWKDRKTRPPSRHPLCNFTVALVGGKGGGRGGGKSPRIQLGRKMKTRVFMRLADHIEWRGGRKKGERVPPSYRRRKGGEEASVSNRI